MQKIVLAAKSKDGTTAIAWKTELLALLGATETESDVDILLKNTSFENFVVRCVENELTPNLIHCMRLLRVVELQHAAEADIDANNNNNNEVQSIAATATSKVSRLLCAICVDPSVGEQLRPHLFGLLALSGASYPTSGIHVAQAASNIIAAIAQHCLTRQLVWFIHDRKMIMHMTDDVKELCGMSQAEAVGQPVPKGLIGADAEKEGLWLIALETIIKLLVASCRFLTTDLVRDFEEAGGYDVLKYAVTHGTRPNGEKIVELLPSLASCPNESTADMTERVACNARIFDILQELLVGSNPVLRENMRRNDNLLLPNLSEPGPLSELAILSIQTGVNMRVKAIVNSEVYSFDAVSALLSATLQMFSDHPHNYEIVEERQHVLSYYLLAFPCFAQEDIKTFILKMLEFVLTGIGMKNEITPVNACVETFFALCHTLISEGTYAGISKDDWTKASAILSEDLNLLGSTLEKLLEFDQRVAPLMGDSMLATKLSSFLDRLEEATAAHESKQEEMTSKLTETTFCLICNVLKLLVTHKDGMLAGDPGSLEYASKLTTIRRMLQFSTNHLGIEAARSMSAVFEAFMSTFDCAPDVESEMRFLLSILNDLASNVLMSSNDQVKNKEVLQRQTVVLALLRSILESMSLARDVFRSCDGFDVILVVLLSMENIATVPGDCREETCKCIQTVFGLLDAVLGMKSRNALSSVYDSPVVLPCNATVDPMSSQISAGSPVAENRNLIRQRGFYLDLAAAVFGTGIMETDEAERIFGYGLSHVDPELKLSQAERVLFIRNPDGLRLVLCLTVFLSEIESGRALAKKVFEQILKLSETSRGSTLRSMASCGLAWTLTSPFEFAPLLFDSSHDLQSDCVLLLKRVASYSMSYQDFVGLVRSVLGPLLTDESSTQVNLPVISSSVKNRITSLSRQLSNITEQDDQRFCERLRLVCDIAGASDRFPRVKVGGDSINSIGILMHDVKADERLRRIAEKGRMMFLEVTSIDALAQSSASTNDLASGAAVEKVWTPLLGSGFAYSVWLRHNHSPDSDQAGNVYILDISSPENTNASTAGSQEPTYLTVWYDTSSQRFTVVSSASHRGEPTCFPVSPLAPNVWNHILLTYMPSKRTMMSRKSCFCMYVNGRALEADVKIEQVNLPPNSRALIGVPNPHLAASGIIRGRILVWELGPCILLSTVLLDLDATAIFAHGPNFPGLLWGDRPQRMSLSATGTLAFSMLAESGEPGSIASALKRRNIQKLEAAGYSTMGHQEGDIDDLSGLGLYCTIPPDCLVFAFQASTTASKLRNDVASRNNKSLVYERLVNLARLNVANENVATDAVIYGGESLVTSMHFSDVLLRAGGPMLLIPIVNAATNPRDLAFALRLIREGTMRHPPNLEYMQGGGGYRILAVLLKEKGFADRRCLDECLAFAITGFSSRSDDEICDFQATSNVKFLDEEEGSWVLSDVDAMKHLLLNHQVWDMQKCGPDISLRLLSALNVLVGQNSIHKSFNARRLHLVGIVRWVLHLMIEGAELYSACEASRRESSGDADVIKQSKMAWYSESPLVSDVTVGGDPGNAFLRECKKLLRRVLTFMLTPGDLEALADGIVFTLSVSGTVSKLLDNATRGASSATDRPRTEEKLLPGPTARLYLVRLLEELIVDGVNEIVAHAAPAMKRRNSIVVAAPMVVRYHSGGVASLNQPYLSTIVARGKTSTAQAHPKHQQAQAFLAAFSGFLTPVWFATVLEGCHEEATATAVLRLLILMLQASSAFESIFWVSGGFSPFVLSVPKFSTCSGITLTLLSELLNVPILHLPFFPRLDPEQLYEVFDSEAGEFKTVQNSEDPSSEIFGLVVECIGRNIKYMAIADEVGTTAKETNDAIIQLIAHRHEVSPTFQEFCKSRSFLEPLSQALCLVYNDRLPSRTRKRVMLTDIHRDLSPTERFVGAPGEVNEGSIGMVRLLRMVIVDAMVSAPCAARVLQTMFQSFPIHASIQQVEALHLILIEQCQSVIKEVLEFGDALFLANCVGLCSVLLDQQTSAFLTAEASLEAVNIACTVLDALVGKEEKAGASLDTAERNLLVMEAAHFAGLICVAALKTSLPMNYHDTGDEDLQAAVLAVIEKNIDSLLLVPTRERKSKWQIPSATTAITKPQQHSRLFPIWQSASLVRCVPNQGAAYPDLSDNGNSQYIVVAPLIIVLQRSLLSTRDDIRGPSVSVLVALLQHRQSVMSELLVTEVKTGNQVETIDVVNRGGFRALLTAHEAALVSDKSGAMSSSVKRKYASFFEWLERNQSPVDIVFRSVDELVTRIFPDFSKVATPFDEAVESKQKQMLMKLTAHSSDSTILGGIERGELARRSAERTTDSHSRWKRQGFDDLAFGATRWKILLRQLKGAGSIWEGGPTAGRKASLNRIERLAGLKARSGKLAPLWSSADEKEELVQRWKLDLSEGHERQRRRLLPNYEFHGIYNLEGADHISSGLYDEKMDDSVLTPEFFVSPEMEATTELLKDLKLKRALSEDEDEFEDDEMDGDGDTAATGSTTANTDDKDGLESQGDNTEASNVDIPDSSAPNLSIEGPADDNEESSSYGLITGLLQPGDWPEKSYNVRRCTGLEVTTALLLWCQDAIYIIDGFEQVGGAGMDGKITRVEREQSSFTISLRPKDFKVSDEKTADEMAASIDGRGHLKNSKQSPRSKSTVQMSTGDVLYQHRSQRIAFSELYSVYRRRYQLQHTALEFHDVHRNGTLVAFTSNEDREEILTKVLQSKLPKSIFSSSYGNFISYTKFMNNLKTKIVNQWVNRKMTNFDFLMHLNSLAGRTFNDLTQYPVFPWVIADYDSEEIDLDDPKTYRDLSKPMGGLGEQRAQQFRERYEALASTCFSDDDPPPFHYGTHYSCAAYVLYYLMRLEPFSRLALALQGGRFDVADRLFHDVGRSWKSASTENLQDVRELIPEFFYLPDFLENTNHFDFGETQRGKTVHDVSLPKWAKGDPRRFVRMNRQALESEYVSRNLHHWVDLIFGYKQRGREAVESLNMFVHVTYEGQVDLDSMSDPIQKASTIAQIQNFGQTPSRLERRPFPQRVQVSIPKIKTIDVGALNVLASLTPPFCIIGAQQHVAVECISTDVCKLGLNGQTDTSVGDVCLLNKYQVVGVGRMSTLVLPSKRYIRFGGLNNGVSVYSSTPRSGEHNKAISFHDALHRAPITAAKASLNGDWLVTGGADSTLKVWRYTGERLILKATLCGHEGWNISCIDVSTEFGVIVSGCGGGRVLLWDLRSFTFVRELHHHESGGPAVSVSVNNSNGNVVTLVGSQLSAFDINGYLIARAIHFMSNVPTCAVATDCPEWMESGVAIVTGHKNGEVNFWSINYGLKELSSVAKLSENPHTSAITTLRVVSNGVRQDTLLVGDTSGKIGLCRTKQLENLSPSELALIYGEH